MSFEASHILEKSPLSVVISDTSQRIVWCNQRFLDETLLTRDEVIGLLYPALPIEAIDDNNQLVQLFSDKQEEGLKFQHWREQLCDSATNNESQVKVHFVDYFIRENSSLKTTGDDAASKSSKLKQLKLPKRVSWIEFLDYEVSRSRRYDNPLSLLKLHLLIQTNPNSVENNTIQQTVKAALMDELRWADMIGRTDRGSFLLVLPETSNVAVKALQTKLKTILARQLKHLDSSIKYSLVFANVSWRKNDDSQKLLDRARTNLVEQLESLLAIQP